MIQTENYGLYKIEHSDDILSSIDAINLNMEKIDENLGAGGATLEETDPTVPQYVKNINESDIENWNDKYNKTEIDTMIGDVETILETLTAGSGVE